VTLGIFNESESRIFGSLTKSRPSYLGNRDKLRISEDLPESSELRTKSSELRTKSSLLLRKYTTRTSEHRNVSTSWIQNNPFSTGFPNSFNEGPATMVLFPHKTVDICLNDGHNDLLQCRSHECLEPSQYDRDGRCYLALRNVDSTNDDFHNSNKST
jgi:hypothetical protein